MRRLTLALVLVLASLGASVASAAPSVAVMIASSSDTSPGVLDAHARGQHSKIVRKTLHDVLRRSGSEVRPSGLGARRLDVAVVSWHITPSARQTEVEVELRVVVADEHGRMLSILTGRARVSSMGPVRGPVIAELREQAIAGAIEGMSDKLQAQIARAVG